MELTKEVYEENYKLLYNIARRFLQDLNFSKDIVHDTYLTYISLDIKLDHRGPKLLLIKILKNHCLAHLNKMKRRSKLNLADIFNYTEEEIHNSFDLKVIEELVISAASQLTNYFKPIFELKYFADLTYREIEEIYPDKKADISIIYSQARKNVIHLVKKAILDKTFSSKYVVKNVKQFGGKIIRDDKTGKVYKSAYGLAKVLNIPYTTLITRLKVNYYPHYKVI